MNFFSLYKRKFLYEIKKKINIDAETDFKNKKLEHIFSHYCTDKASTYNQNRKKGHGFTKYYEDHLSKYKNKKINILEIGSYSGASAAAFSKYFPESTIYCLDVNISNFKYYSKKINVFGLDISQKKMINKFYNKIKITESDKFFDIIIDDGSHKLSDILIAFKYLFKNLNNSGVYVIEDFKFPNYFDHLKDIKHVKIDTLIDNLNKKIFFESKIIDKNFQIELHQLIRKIRTYKGNSEHSDIAFMEKNV